MKINEIKRTKTIEEVVRTEYVAEDGMVFFDKAECEKYEESALFAVSRKLKVLARTVMYEINEDASDEKDAEIFDIQTQEDLDNLAKYIILKLRKCSYYSEKDTLTELAKITIGHEVIIQWSYDNDAFYVDGDGSIEAYGNHFKQMVRDVIEKANKKEAEIKHTLTLG